MSDVLVLGYHSISPSWPAATSVTPAQLEQQLTLLVERGYQGATLSEALTTPRSERVLVLTFDDAHRSVLEYGHPILARLGLPGTLFVPTSYAASGAPMAWPGYEQWVGGPHEGELGCMSWPELTDLAGQGWEIGSHTRSHPRLTRLDDAALADELEQSRRDCEARLGRACYSLAYPYSDYDDRVVSAARSAGYRFAVTIPRRFKPPLPLQWPRVGVYHTDSAMRFRLRLLRRSSGPRLPQR